jgi:hypothetical protein
VFVAVAGGLTVTETAADVLPGEFPWPEYAAVKLYVPAARDVMESVATPEEFSVAVPSTVEPFMKVTVPFDAVALLPLTVAVKVST